MDRGGRDEEEEEKRISLKVPEAATDASPRRASGPAEPPQVDVDGARDSPRVPREGCRLRPGPNTFQEIFERDIDRAGSRFEKGFASRAARAPRRPRTSSARGFRTSRSRRRALRRRRNAPPAPRGATGGARRPPRTSSRRRRRLVRASALLSPIVRRPAAFPLRPWTSAISPRKVGLAITRVRIAGASARSATTWASTRRRPSPFARPSRSLPSDARDFPTRAVGVLRREGSPFERDVRANVGEVEVRPGDADRSRPPRRPGSSSAREARARRARFRTTRRRRTSACRPGRSRESPRSTGRPPRRKGASSGRPSRRGRSRARQRRRAKRSRPREEILRGGAAGSPGRDGRA